MTCRWRAVGVALLASALAASVSAQPVEWPSEGPPRPLAARRVNFPPYEIRTLENGLQVMAVLHHEQPVVSMRMLVRAGSALDPRGKAGLADLAASLLDQGTTTKTASEMNDAIDFIGGGMGAGAGTDLTFVNVLVMKDSFETGLRMLSDMARHPAFAPEEIERRRQQALSTLQVNFQDPEFVANAVFDRLVYGFHPYGMPQGGTPETLASITRQDLVAFHEQNFVPNNAILAIVGDVTAEEAFEGVRKVFGDWQRREIRQPELVAPPDPTRRVIIVNKPDAVQTEVRVGHLGVKRISPDYMPLNLALRILGGEGANRLHQVLRSERSLTYGAKADMDTLLHSGDFEASTNTRSDATGEVLRLIVDQFWRLQRERVGDRELSDAKAYMTGSFPLTIETPDAIATQVLNVLFYGLPVEQLQSFRERVNVVRPDDIERVARFYLRPDRLSIVLVGNASAFASQLRGLGFEAFETIEMGDLDLMAVDFKRAGGAGRAGGARRPGGTDARPRNQYRGARLPLPASGPAASPTAYLPAAAAPVRAASAPVQTASAVHAPSDAARALLDKVIAAKGGLERLRAIRTIKATTRASAVGKDAPEGVIDTVTYLSYPDRVRVESMGERGRVVQVYDGARAWIEDATGTHDVPSRGLDEVRAGLKRDTIAVLLAAARGEMNVRLLPESRDAGGAKREALEFSSVSLDPMVLYIDPGTYLVARQTYVAGGVGRALIEEILGDYRPVDGVPIAFTTSVRVSGDQVLERRVTAIDINAELPPDLFARPRS